MTFSEYQKLPSGTRVFTHIAGRKVNGTVGTVCMDAQCFHVVRFDNGAVAQVTSADAHLISIELPN